MEKFIAILLLTPGVWTVGDLKFDFQSRMVSVVYSPLSVSLLSFFNLNKWLISEYSLLT